MYRESEYHAAVETNNGVSIIKQVNKIYYIHCHANMCSTEN